MPHHPSDLHRRTVLAGLAGAGLVGAGGAISATASPAMVRRTLPATGESIPGVCLGTLITFNVGNDPALRAALADVMRAFFELGGSVIDSSPMYGSSEAVIGDGLARLGTPRTLFAATKVWTWRQGTGPDQMAESRRLWEVERFDAMQIHNLLGWEGHLETLLEDRAQGRIRLIGITTSHGRDHDTFAAIMARRPIDLVQFTYNIVDREAEARLLPLAAERGLGVIVNRPFRQGDLIRRVSRHPLPAWAAEIHCRNWAQVLLKFILSHPAVTCAIPATTRVDHLRENMGAMRGPLPDMALRERMARHVRDL